MQPRIYTYKITFEEVPYYYYGSKKEKYFNEEYWGSPVTNKWCWELYTPKKQILEIFDYTDEGYEECRRVENRLIKPVLNDPWCLNEICGGIISLDVCRKNGRKTKELGKGIYARTKEKIYEDARKGGQRAKELGLGVHALTKEQMYENGKKYGKSGGQKTYELGKGVHKRTKEQMTEDGRKGGKITGKLSQELCKGIFALTSEERMANAILGGKVSGSQRWKCLETGFITNAGNLTKYQKARGIDTSLRERIS